MTPLLTRSATLLLVLLATACAKNDDATPAVDANDNLAMGNPSGAVASTTSPTNYLLTRSQYTVGYNRDQGKPIWVSWRLGQTDLGNAVRQNDFRADESLPRGWYLVQSSDYTGYGFDRLGLHK
jgi:endonuclease G